MSESIKSVEMLDEKVAACTKCFDDKISGNDGKRHILLCGGTGCLSSNSKEIKEKFNSKLVVFSREILKFPRIFGAKTHGFWVVLLMYSIVG